MATEGQGISGSLSDSAARLRYISTTPRTGGAGARLGIALLQPLSVASLAAGAPGAKLTADNRTDSQEAKMLKTSRAASGRGPDDFESRDPLEEVEPQPPLPNSVYLGFPLGGERNRKSQMTIRPPPQRRGSNMQVYAHFSDIYTKGKYRMTAKASSRVSLGRFLAFGSIAGVLAAVANAVVYLLASALGAMPNSVLAPGGAPITLFPVVLSSFVPALVAAVLLVVLGRFTRRPFGIFQTVAVVLLVLSLVTPFTIPGAPAGMIATLLIMHALAAAAIIWVLTILAPQQALE